MGLTNQELLQKAALSTSDFNGGVGVSAPLTINQVATFLRLAITPQAILPDVRTVQSDSNKWQESQIDFASRIMKPGTEGARLTDAAGYERQKPTTNMVEISTVLIRGESPITDEVLEDQVERAGFGDTVMAMIAEAAGRDIEDLMLNGDTDNSVVGHDGSVYMLQLDGWLKRACTQSGNHVYDAVGDAQDYQTIFNKLVTSIPDKYKRDMSQFRFYVPRRLEEKWREGLAQRGTPMGDMMIMGNQALSYQGVPIKAVPLMQIVAGTPDKSFILLTHRMNLYAGFRRMIKMETFRDPREGATSFIITARVDSKVGVVGATACAKNVDVEP